jgi:hypothetical protein
MSVPGKSFLLFGFVGIFVVLGGAGACGGDGESGPGASPSPTPLATLARDVVFSGEVAGLPATVERLPQTGDYVINIIAPTADRWREGKAELEKLLPSLVPDPCAVQWSPPSLLRDELGPEDLLTAGCQ